MASNIARLKPDGEDVVFEWIAGGATMKSIAAELGRSVGLVYQWIHQTPEREEKFRQARKMAGFAHAETGLEIVDQDALTPAAVHRNARRAAYRQWLAERYNREAFGEAAKETVQVTLNIAHLQALQAFGGPLPRVEERPALMSAEVVNDD
jgi:transposase